jgi:hypothetical protein
MKYRLWFRWDDAVLCTKAPSRAVLMRVLQGTLTRSTGRAHPHAAASAMTPALPESPLTRLVQDRVVPTRRSCPSDP